MTSVLYPARMGRRRIGARGAVLNLEGWAPVMLVVLGAAALRLHGLAAQSFWGDEIGAVEIARMPLRLLWSGWMVRETNPPLYYSILHLWMGLFGDGEFAVRSLSVLIGTGAVLLVCALGRRVADAQTGLVGAVLAACWVSQLHYSQEARGYILGACGALTAVIGLCGLADDALRRRSTADRGKLLADAAMYVGGCLVALYSHTTNVLLPVLANLYFAWLFLARSPRRKDAALVWIALNLLVAVAWAWWGWITWRQLHLGQTNVAWMTKPNLQHGLGAILTAYGPAADSDSHTLAFRLLKFVGAPLVLVAGGFGLTRMKFERGAMLFTFGVGAPLLLFLLSQKTPVMLPRTFLWAQFAPILAFAAAIAAIRPPMWRAGVLVASGAALLLGATYQPPKEPWREITAGLARVLKPGDTVLVSSVSAGVYLQHYCEATVCGAHIVDVIEPQDGQNRWASDLFHGREIEPGALTRLAAGGTIWAVSRWSDDPRPQLRSVAHPIGTPFAVTLPDFITVSAWRGATPE